VTRAILESAGQAVERCRASAAGLLGCMRIGFTVSASYSSVATSCLPTFREAFEKVDLVLKEARLSPDLVIVLFLPPLLTPTPP